MTPKKFSSAKPDLAVCVLVLVGSFALAGYLDLAELWHSWSQAHGDWQVDELLPALGLSSVGLAWYSFRRWREARREADFRNQMNRRLQEETATRKRTEGLLRESETWNRQASRFARVGDYLWDTEDDCCLHCSTELARIHDLTPIGYLAQTTTLNDRLSSVYPDDRDAVKEAIRAVRHGRTLEFEYRIVTARGDLRYLRQISKPVLDASGSVIQEHGMSQDVTEIRRAGERLCHLQTMEVVGRLTGGLAHEYNNLLAIIRGHSELLDGHLGANVVSLAAIQGAVVRGSQLTQQLLAYSQLQTLKPKAIHLGDLVSDNSMRIARSLGDRTEFEASADPDLWKAVADKAQVELALINLVLNARDAMPDGGKLTIRCANARLDQRHLAESPDVRPGHYVELTVMDTGTGMSAEVGSKATQPFFTTKEVGKGSGLGLSMVYGFIKQSGGHAAIISEVDCGTTIKLYLPRAGPGAA